MFDTFDLEFREPHRNLFTVAIDNQSRGAFIKIVSLVRTSILPESGYPPQHMPYAFKIHLIPSD